MAEDDQAGAADDDVEREHHAEREGPVEPRAQLPWRALLWVEMDDGLEGEAGEHGALRDQHTVPINVNKTASNVARKECLSGFHLTADLNGSIALSLSSGVDQSLTTE